MDNVFSIFWCIVLLVWGIINYGIYVENGRKEGRRKFSALGLILLAGSGLIARMIPIYPIRLSFFFIMLIGVAFIIKAMMIK